MNSYKIIAGAGAVLVASTFSAAADEHRDHDFQIPGSYFPQSFSSAAAVKEPIDVPIYCREDFVWESGSTPQPNVSLTKRIDNNGFNGGDPGEIAFLLMDDAGRQGFLAELTNPDAIDDYKGRAAEYDLIRDPEEKRAFAENTFTKFHRWWNKEKYKQISDHCYSGGHAPKGYTPPSN